MLTPLEITFQGIERSDAVEARIREKFKRIESHFDRITHARVAIQVPRKRADRPKTFHVTIDIGIPGHKPIIAKHEPNGEDAHTDIMLAIRDAFAAAQRQVDAQADRMDHPAKKERSRRKPTKPEVADQDREQEA